MKDAPKLHVILVHPEIPPNTGNIARLCGATGTALHLVRPLGFSTDAKALRRAGLDYWSEVDVSLHDDFGSALNASGDGPVILFSARAGRSYLDAPYAPGARLVFGSETRGLPAEILEKYKDRVYGIPIWGRVRSLNLSTAAGIAVYEGYRRIGALDGFGLDHFAPAAGLPGRIFIPGGGTPKKHHCPDCFNCGWCPDERCSMCRGKT